MIRFHLEGNDERGRDFVIGVYPMLRDETCWFLAVDFDKISWKDDALAFLETCHDLKIPAALERSRSGKGAHVWIFFDAPLCAPIARSLGTHILTETMEHRPDIGLDSYDRLFPNQDTLPTGGFGNLIALPLQRRARDRGNSLFVDDRLQPYNDQWAFLDQVRRLPCSEAEAIVDKAMMKGRIVGVRLVPEEDELTPWRSPPSRRSIAPPVTGPLPGKLELTMGNELFIPTVGLSPSLRNRLIRVAAFQNPEFYRAQAMRLPTYKKPRVIGCAREYSHHIGIPRGCLDEIQRLLSDLGIKLNVVDERNAGERLDVSFTGRLLPEQKLAADELLRFDTGVLSAATAFGKTVVGANLIARRRVNTLVVVHRRQLLEQWVERLATFLSIPKSDIGIVGGGKRDANGCLDVALIQSLIRLGEIDDLLGRYGQVIFDECHHIPARSFEEVARQAKAKFILGLSATPIRKDGHHPIIFMQCGEIRYRVDARKQAIGRPFDHTVIVCPTDFRPIRPEDPDARLRFQDLYDELTTDNLRNQAICRDIVKAVREGHFPLVLTERKEHLEVLAEQLTGNVDHLITFMGGMGQKALREARAKLASIPREEARVLLATGAFIGEGFDDARLDTLFLTLPISWKGTVAQYLGRLHRLHRDKHEVRVYDYADLNVPMLSRMFDRRCRGYEAAGYRILLPASALSGWPADVPLPIDPEWKKDYAASVRRLVRDGVDRKLADLFTLVSPPILTAQNTGVSSERARSASESFLFRRLETLDQTKGRFHMNVEIPIQFNERGSMEVDFLCRDLSIVLELDGDQHLASADAYRSDRRKDYLLQEHGYLVLRFLASDLGRRLDDVIDTVLRAMEHQALKATRSMDAIQ